MFILNNSGRHVHLQCHDEDTPQFRRILVEILPNIMEKFSRKNRAYGDRGYPLGPAGQYPEIRRKVDMLEAIIWDQRKSATTFDDADQVIDDLIGHLLMTKDCLRELRHGRPHFKLPQMVERKPDGTVGPITTGPPIGSIATGGIAQQQSGHGGNADLAEQGRRLASEREDLIAYGVHPADLAVPRYPDDSAAHRIREAKGGPEVWAPYQDIDLSQTRNMMASGDRQHSIRVALPNEERCGWKSGDPACQDDSNQCVGVEGHGVPDSEGRADGAEQWHINARGESWSIS